MSTDTQQNDNNESMDRTITISEDGTTLPVVEVLTGRGFVTGKSGSGKSNSAGVISEELLEQNFPLMIVDTAGEYYGLKEAFELLHVGADEECDLQVGPEHAEKLAELALEQNVPIILDVSGYIDESDRNALLFETARYLFAKAKKVKQPFLLLVEEIHNYVPQKGSRGDVGDILVTIAKQGRKHGLGLLGMSQRPASVEKDYITQCDWLVWHRLTWDNDTKVAGSVLGDTSYAEEIQHLDAGEAFLMTDWSDDIRRIQWKRKETFDAGATPDLDGFERPDLKSVSGDLVDDLQDISDRKQREEDRIEELERRLEEKGKVIDAKNDEIANLEGRLEAVKDTQDMKEEWGSELTEALGTSLSQLLAGDADEAQTTIQAEVAEIREQKDERIATLQQEKRDLESKLAERDERIEKLEARIETLEAERAAAQEQLDRLDELNLEEAEEAHARLGESLGIEGDGEAETLRRKLRNARERVEDLEDKRPDREQELDVDPLENRQVKRFVDGMREQIASLSDTKRAMLRYYIVRGPAQASDAYKYAGNSPSSSRRKQYSAELCNAGLLKHVEGETYGYALRETIEDELGGHFDDAELNAVEERLEDLVDEKVLQEMKA